MSREDALRKLAIRLSHLAEGSDPGLPPLLDKLRLAVRQGADEVVLNRFGEVLAKKMAALETAPPATEVVETTSLGTMAAEFSESIKSLNVDQEYHPELMNLADSLVVNNDLNQQLVSLKEIFKVLRLATDNSRKPVTGGEAVAGPAELEPFLDKTATLLGNVLEHINLLKGDTTETSRLVEQLASSASLDSVEGVLDEVLNLLVSLGELISEERTTAQTFLGGLREQLHSVEEVIFSVLSDGDGSLERAASLERQVSNDVEEMGKAVEETDLDALKRTVEKGLENLSSKVADYLAEEKEHHLRNKTKVKNLTRKVREMEAEAANLRGEIKTKQDLAVKDPLTGVYNRAGYEERVAEEFSRRARVEMPLSMVFIDCNKFKEINDTFGHNAGDVVLMKVAETLKKRARSSDVVCRYGGDEFVVLLPDTPLEGAKVFAEACCERILEAGFNNNGQPLDVSISCGVTEITDSDNSETALKRADEAMYKAKKLTGVKVAVLVDQSKVNLTTAELLFPDD
ncbi:MAG: diguanylate cyclase [Porticoccaceae bacterium]|nr:diguanylate cyclase [Pseudomonadales bacterium]MCP5173051.1 diguanylate cyclase [Pseudomonadales bacterium]MCP5302525.1 diguanylate cyclase [Pseudomonadales bacterium]